jgi:hypothetical protein
LKQRQTFEDVLSYNVVGEMTALGASQRIMVVGGHLDSWDLEMVLMTMEQDVSKVWC